jgi:hypothetical protein
MVRTPNLFVPDHRVSLECQYLRETIIVIVNVGHVHNTYKERFTAEKNCDISPRDMSSD